jgi:hypothetical protein
MNVERDIERMDVSLEIRVGGEFGVAGFSGNMVQATQASNQKMKWSTVESRE